MLRFFVCILILLALPMGLVGCEGSEDAQSLLETENPDADGGGNSDEDGVNSPPDNDPAPATLSSLNDEFDDPASLSQWTVRSDFESQASDGSATIVSSQMRLLPLADSYFLNANKGLSLFKRIDASAFPNFIIEGKVNAYERGTTNVPTSNYHAAGIVVYPDLSAMSNWTVANIGRQNGSAGFEGKNTEADSSSLMLYATGGVSEGRVRICVVGTSLTVYTRLNTDGAWTERRSFTHTIGTQIGAGVMINDFQTATADMEGQFDYVRFEEISGAGDCETDI